VWEKKRTSPPRSLAGIAPGKQGIKIPPMARKREKPPESVPQLQGDPPRRHHPVVARVFNRWEVLVFPAQPFCVRGAHVAGPKKRPQSGHTWMAKSRIRMPGWNGVELHSCKVAAQAWLQC